MNSESRSCRNNSNPLIRSSLRSCLAVPAVAFTLLTGCATLANDSRPQFNLEIPPDQDPERIVAVAFTEYTQPILRRGRSHAATSHWIEDFETQITGPVVPEARVIRIVNQANGDEVKIKYNGKEGVSDGFRLVLGKGWRALSVQEGENPLHYQILRSRRDSVALSEGSIILEVEKRVEELPPVIINDPYWSFHFGYPHVYYHHHYHPFHHGLYVHYY